MSSLNVSSRKKIGIVPGHAGRPLFLGLMLGAGLVSLGLAGCKSNTAANPADTTATATDPNAQDPTAANLAPVDNSTQVAGAQEAAQPTEQSQTYSNPAPAPVERRRRPSTSSGEPYPADSSQGYSSDNGQGYDQDAAAEQGYNSTLTDLQAPQPPPPLPEYAQPEAPEPNSLWTPGYWSYAQSGYYWVPGAWVQAPYTGALWTPGYWGGYGNGYRFHHGFWGPHIGFYGGINYGFGYVGVGYQGGYWNGPHFSYNQYANNINVNINPGFRQAVYQRNVTSVNNTVINNRVVNNTTINNTTINNRAVNNVSYNGGRGGVEAQPRPAELAVLREPRVAPMQAQVQNAKAASSNPQQFYVHNQGRPAEVAAPRALPAQSGINAPSHTTAEINRAAPAQEQLRQHQEMVKAQARPAAAAPANIPQPARPGTPAQAQHPVTPQERPAAQTHLTPMQAAHPASAQAAHVNPQQQTHPVPAARPEPANRPAPAARPEPAARPQPQQHTAPAPARPQQETRPAPQARPQPAAHPQPQAKPAPKPEARPENHVQQKPEPHNRNAA